MVQRTKRRTSIQAQKNQLTVGYKTKSRFASVNGSALYEGKFLITLYDGSQGIEYGYSNGDPLTNSKEMEEGAELHAKSKFLYREGYYVDKENYEELDLEKVRDVLRLDYNYYYPENSFSYYTSHKDRYGNIIMSRRDAKGRIRESSKVAYSGRTSVRNEQVDYANFVSVRKSEFSGLSSSQKRLYKYSVTREMEKRKLLSTRKRFPKKYSSDVREEVSRLKIVSDDDLSELYRLYTKK